MCYGGEFHNHIIVKLYDRILLRRKTRGGFPCELTLELLSEGLRCQPNEDSLGNKTMGRRHHEKTTALFQRQEGHGKDERGN